MYTLRAVFPGDPRNIVGVSDDVTVTVQQKQNPTFTINTSAPVIPAGGSVQITGVLDKPGSTTTAEANTEVTLYGHEASSTWQAAAAH